MKFLLMLLMCVSAHAEPIEFVVRGAAGGPDDVLTRKIIQQIDKDTNLKFVAINKAGAAHVIAYNYVESKTAPMLVIADKNMLNHSVINSSERIFTIGEFTNVLFVKNGTNIRSFDDLVKLSKTREIRFGHGGVGTFSWAAADAVCQKTIRCLLVPYKSGAPGMFDLLTDTIDAFALASYGATTFLANNQYRAVMTFTARKHPVLNLPVLPAKYQDLEIQNWLAIYGRNLTDKDQTAIQRALDTIDPAFFTEQGFYK
jgi:tripartite-type tricarboxylate transporter receptor subunit TctC